MTATSYDEIPYTSKVIGYSQPYKLATVARLFGLQTPSVETCRVLEIGCAAGINLIAMAEASPKATFIGIDLSARQINEGLDTIAQLGLDNIKLRQMDIMESSQELGMFDYIIVHGIYSWVPDAVQDKILEICHDNLSPKGVAYVSYNTYPGWHVQGMVRQMMLYHTQQFGGSVQQIEQAKALLKFLVDATRELTDLPGTEYKFYTESLRSTLDLIQKINDDAYLFHEYLEENNTPIFFHQFAERAMRHQLMYLGDLAVGTMLASQFPPSIMEKLQLFENDIVRQEQFMDFLRNRTFRRSLLCHQDIQLTRMLQPETITDLHVLSNLLPAAPIQDIRSTTREKFVDPEGKDILVTASPAIKAALLQLGLRFPQSLHFPDLLNQVMSLISTQDTSSESNERIQAQQAIAKILLKLYVNGQILLSPVSFRPVAAISEYPVATPLARLQASQGKHSLASALFENVSLPPLAHFLLPLLDGQHNLDSLVDAVMDALKQGRLHFDSIPREMSDEQFRASLSLAVKKALLIPLRLGLLVK